MNPNRPTSSFSALRALAAVSLCLVFGLAGAQEDALPDADPPDRAARLSFLQGEVSLQPAGEEEWADAIVNRPLTTGDKLWTDQGARAEIDVGQAAVRLDSSTGFSFLNVDDDTIQMRITSGVISVSVRALEGNEHIEIDTPNLAVSLLRPGNYRVEVNDEGDATIVRVSEGLAEATGGSQTVIVHAQQMVTFSGAEQLAAQFSTLGAPDEFDSWSLERDRRDERVATSQTAQYVSPDVTGFEDLDDNGTWSSEQEYGYVWTPRVVAVDWSPYRYGRWAWVRPWGWTWIDDAPWGYAPFHYGRWAHVRNRWCWVPGPRHVRPVYAPALVGWHVRDRLAWFPLGPRDVYVPSRRYSHRYVERVNVANTSVSRAIVRKIYDERAAGVTYRNRAVPGAITETSRAAFTSAQRIGGQRIRVDEREFARTPATAMAPRIEPIRESRLGANQSRRNVRLPPQEVVARQVIVKRNPPPSGEHFVRRPREEQRHDPVSRPTRPQESLESTSAGVIRNVKRPDRPDRPAHSYQPRVEDTVRQAPPPQSMQRSPVVRQAEVRQQLREHLERQQQGQQQQAARQVEVQQQQREQYQRREQHQQREQQQRQERQPQREQQQPRVEQPRVEQPRPAAPRPDTSEQRQRAEPRRQADDKPQPQRDQDNSRRGSWKPNRQ